MPVTWKRRTFICWVFLGLLTCPPLLLGEQAEEEARGHFEKGVEFNQQRQFTEARNEFQQAVSLDLENYKYHQALVLNYIQTRQGPLALQLYKGLERDHPQSAAVHYWYGRVYLESGSLPDAAREFSEAARLAPQDEHPFVSLGHVYYRMGKQDEALKAYLRAEALKPGIASVLAGIGNVYYVRKDYDKAKPAYLKALKIDPTLTDARYNLSLIYKKQGETGKAIEEWKKMLEDDPNESGAREQLARAYFLGEQYEDAAEQYYMLSLVRQESPGVFFALGESEILWAATTKDAEKKKELLEEAQGAFQQTLDLDPKNERARKYLEVLKGGGSPVPKK